MDAAGLRATVDEYNAAATAVPFDPMRHDGKRAEGIEPPKSDWAQPLTEGPFEAWPVEPRICFTYHGLRVDGETRVLDGDGQPIPGLQAAGEITGIFHGTYPAGTSVLRSLTFGRLAGRAAASSLPHGVDVSVSIYGSRQDVREVSLLMAAGHVEVTSTTYPLDQVATAWEDLVAGRVLGRAIVVP